MNFSENVVSYLTQGESYLHQRKQIRKILIALSIPHVLHYGVPQGSNLGPLLFLMYIY